MHWISVFKIRLESYLLFQIWLSRVGWDMGRLSEVYQTFPPEILLVPDLQEPEPKFATILLRFCTVPFQM